MTEVYVVIGSCGEYSDRNEWPVCWCATKAQAQAQVAKLDAQAKAFDAWYNSTLDEPGSYSSMEERRRALVPDDPHHQHGYTGTRYGIWVVEAMR